MQIKIDDKFYLGNPGETIMEVANRNNIEIPSLCHKKGFEGLGRCRMCLVEIKDRNRKKIVSSCQYPVKEGLEVTITTEEIFKIRQDIVMLLMFRSPENLYIQNLAEEYEVKAPVKYIEIMNSDDCILCGLCVEACAKLGTSAISLVSRGITKKVSTPYDDESKDCIGCTSCAAVCPTDAIKFTDIDGKRTIWNRSFDLVKCEVCGVEFTTEETLKYTNILLGDDQDNKICDKCKKKTIASTFKESFKNFY